VVPTEKRRKRAACIDPHGYNAGKKIKGKKRHIVVDTLGLLLHAIVHPADVQDRDGGVLVRATLFGMFPFLKTLFADSGYQGPKFAKALAATSRREIRQTFRSGQRICGLAQTLDR
jgi:transposase